jgi:hypothetical protein
MRQQWASLACLLKSVSRNGSSARWDLSDIKYQGDYPQPWGSGTMMTSKQFIGDVELNNGAQVGHPLLMIHMHSRRLTCCMPQHQSRCTCAGRHALHAQTPAMMHMRR